MLPQFYQTHLQRQLTRAQFIVFSLLLALIQQHKTCSPRSFGVTLFLYTLNLKAAAANKARFLVLPQITTFEYLVSPSALKGLQPIVKK